MVVCYGSMLRGIVLFIAVVSFTLAAPVAKENKTINPQDLKIPDHLQGVKLERDGHLNKDFRKEVFLGKENDDSTEEPSKLLADVFHLADVNSDDELDLKELSKWIEAKVKEHLDEAIRENVYLFTAVDKNRNGIVTWKEYHVNFMMDQGFDEKYAKNHAESHKNLDRKAREQILLEEAAFSETAHSNPEGLNIDEFLSFRHPEHSHATLLSMVTDIFNDLDENNDDFLSVKEFATFSNGGPDPSHLKETDRVWQQERQKEFEENIDANHDGQVTREELLFYSDPQNPAHAKTEARNLIAAADSNHSGTLSLKEILDKKEIFLGSKMVNIARNFHDEF